MSLNEPGVAMNQQVSAVPAGVAVSTNWSGLFLSLLMPVMTAMIFFYQSLIADWRRLPDEWIVGLILIGPLEFVRALILQFLGDAYKESTGPMEAVKSFLLSIAILLVPGIVFLFLKAGPKAAISFLSEPLMYSAIGFPILILVIDSIVGIFVFKGDPHKQAIALNAIVDDSIDWLSLTLLRVPFVILPLYALLLWAHSAGWRFADWVPAPTRGLAVRGIMFYLGCYFLGKAVLVAHVQTARFAATGKRLFDTRWMVRVRGKGNS
jgi:hypothetical protein